jgi:hypothetical protein
MKAQNEQERAAVLVFAVLLLTAGVFVLTAIAQLAATQAVVGRDEWSLLDRRVTLHNSRAMARQFVLARMFNGTVSNPVQYSDPDLGGFSISNSALTDYWEPVMAQANTSLKINPFNPMERGGFYPALLEASLSDGADEVEWRLLVRTRSPIAAGYSYVRQYPATEPDLDAAIRCAYVEGSGSDRYMRFVGGTNSMDIPDVPMSSTTNTNAADPNGYQGSFAVPITLTGSQFTGGVSVEAIDNPSNPTKLRVVIDLQEDGFTLSSSDEGLALHYIVLAQANFTNTNVSSPTVVNTNVTELMIKGSTDGFRQPPLLIVVTNHPYLTNIILSGRNAAPYDGRRVYLQLDSPGQPQVAISVTNNDAATWRLGLSARNCGSLDFSGLGAIELVGGLRTDADVPSGLKVVSENDPGGQDFVADQMMWLEDYRAP